MALYQDPRSIINTDALTHDERLQPANIAGLAIRSIATALSNAGFEVYADTWNLSFHEPRGHIAGGTSRALAVLARPNCTFALVELTSTTQQPTPIATVPMLGLRDLIAVQFPSRTIADPAQMMYEDVHRRLRATLLSANKGAAD